MASEVEQNAGLYDLLGWLETNKKRVITGLVVLAVLVALAIAFFQHQRQRESRASAELSKIKVPYNPGQPAAAGTVEALLKVAQEYTGTRAAARAILQAAGIQFSEGNYTAAQATFTRISQEYPDCEWVGQAALGVAASLGAQGKTNDAIAQYETARKRFASHEVTDDIKLSLARLYEGTNPEEAFKIYDEMVKAAGGVANVNQMGGLAAEAGMKLEDLVKRRPELEKLRTPPTPPAPQITMMTNTTSVTNVNLQTLTNRAGSNMPIQIRTLPASSSPTPGAPNTTPGISPAPAPVPPAEKKP